MKEFAKLSQFQLLENADFCCDLPRGASALASWRLQLSFLKLPNPRTRGDDPIQWPSRFWEFSPFRGMRMSNFQKEESKKGPVGCVSTVASTTPRSLTNYRSLCRPLPLPIVNARNFAVLSREWNQRSRAEPETCQPPYASAILSTPPSFLARLGVTSTRPRKAAYRSAPAFPSRYLANSHLHFRFLISGPSLFFFSFRQENL